MQIITFKSLILPLLFSFTLSHGDYTENNVGYGSAPASSYNQGSNGNGNFNPSYPTNPNVPYYTSFPMFPPHISMPGHSGYPFYHHNMHSQTKFTEFVYFLKNKIKICSKILKLSDSFSRFKYIYQNCFAFVNVIDFNEIELAQCKFKNAKLIIKIKEQLKLLNFKLQKNKNLIAKYEKYNNGKYEQKIIELKEMNKSFEENIVKLEKQLSDAEINFNDCVNGATTTTTTTVL